MAVTIFNDLFVTDTPFTVEIGEALELIKNNPEKDFINKIRTLEDKSERNKLKQKLKCILFSGTFSKRKAINVVEHSGFACLDFDDLEDAEAFKEELKQNNYIYSAFISPSGNGVKALVKIPAEINNHKKYYEALCETFETKLDDKTKDISRVCYESYDPTLWVNEDSKTWVLKKEFTEVTINNDYPEYFKIKEVNTKVDVIQKWFNKKFTLNVGEINNNLYKLACALNKAGMSQSDCEFLINNEYSNGNKADEINKLIASAYKNTSEHNTLTLIDDTKVNKAREITKKGNAKAKKELKRNGASDEEIEDILEFDFEEDFLIFWDERKGKIELNDFKFKLFLENRGFYKVQLNEKEFTFVKVYNNIISEINETMIKDFVLQHVEQIDLNVYNFFARATARFSENYLNQLSTRELTMLRDNEENSFLFFKNKIIKISKDSIEYIDYIDCGGLVWKKNIIPHSFEFSTTKSDFESFINNVSNQDAERKLMLECSIGYLLNTYKKQNEGVAIILYDETLNDNPSGRTGKTVISKAVGQLRKTTTLNGKEFNTKGQFPYQTINLDDNILVFDDLTRTFKFEELFSLITGDLTLNKKNLQPIVIPYAESPKILFTSNYILSGTGDSHDARKVEIELYRHYSKSFEPKDDFGKLFFSIDWNKKDWDAFFSYMIGNMQRYFNNGIIKTELASGKTRKMISNTNEDFFDFCENDYKWDENTHYTTKKIFEQYNDGAREVPRNMTMNWFGRWISMYVDFKDWKREDIKSNGLRTFKIKGIGQEELITEEIEF